MSDRIRVLLVDDQELVRYGFRLVLEAQDDIVVVGEASDGADLASEDELQDLASKKESVAHWEAQIAEIIQW